MQKKLTFNWQIFLQGECINYRYSAIYRYTLTLNLDSTGYRPRIKSKQLPRVRSDSWLSEMAQQLCRRSKRLNYTANLIQGCLKNIEFFRFFTRSVINFYNLITEPCNFLQSLFKTTGLSCRLTVGGRNQILAIF